MKTAILCLGLLVIVATSSASLDDDKTTPDGILSEELDHSGAPSILLC